MRLSLSFAFVLFSAFRLNEACGFEGAEGGKIPAVVGRASRAVKSRFTLRKPLKYNPSYYAQFDDEESSSSDAQVPSTESSGWSSSRKMRSAPASKKGLGAWYNATVEGVMEDVGASWFFNWRPSTWNANIVPPPGIEFVSMIQRGADVTPQNLEIVREEPAKALLTFNEPDHEEPRLSVAEALALWPLLETTGKLLGSPVTATKPLQSPWLSEFMYEAEKRNLRVDFLNVHYFNNSPDRWGTRIAVKDTEVFLDNTYAYYKKPIWVTEWGLTQWLPDPH